MKPFVKWAGGKRQILGRIKEFINNSIKPNTSYRYIEPFLGGGAVFFAQEPQNAIINDLNEDLINAYKVIQSNEYETLIERLRQYEEEYRTSEERDQFYYEIRKKDREEDWPDNYSAVERAARMIFLNKTCYNGLYRVNQKGEFNTPIGRYQNPLICDEDNIREIHNYLSSPNNHISIMSGSYEEVIKLAKDDDVIYIDPPYDYEDDDGFTKYQINGFTFEDFEKLKKLCDKAIENGAHVIISNNATEKVMNLFKSDPFYKICYEINKLSTLRSINCKGAERKTGQEVIFWGSYENIPFPQANDMERIIALLKLEGKTLDDKKRIMEIIHVNSERQVMYYFSALQYFKFLDSEYHFTARALETKGDEKKIKEAIYTVLNELSLFKKLHRLFLDKREADSESVFKVLIEENVHQLSENTLRRRASTIKSWVDWMYKYEDKNEL